jgi:hypothetical protein
MDEIARYQGADMRAAVEQASRSAAAMENVSTSMEAVAQSMAVSSEAANDSVAALRERTAQQMRAYITVLIGTATAQDRGNGVKFQVAPLVVNSGNTPAYKLGYKMRAGVLPYPLPADYQLPHLRQMVGESIMGPQQQIVLIEGTVVEDFVADQDVEYVKYALGGKALYGWGLIMYEDIFGEKHQTEFCQSVHWLPNGSVWGIYTPGRNRAN